MEAVRDFLPFRDADQARSQAVDSGVADVLAVLQRVCPTAVADAASWGFEAASDFAGQVEEASRAMEYLQLVAADAVDRARKDAAAQARTGAATTGWTTGWRDTPGSGDTGSTDTPVAAAAAADGIFQTNWSAEISATSETNGTNGRSKPHGTSGTSAAVDDGYRNTAEFLRARLRISAADARRRLALAADVLPRTGFGALQQAPVRGELGAAVAAAEVASRAASIIAIALDRVRHVCDDETAARMEHALTRTAAENDSDILVRVARNWTDAIDQDGAEPSEERLRQVQGAFIRPPRHGLHHLEIFATAEQFEHLLTVMNTATNPRTPAPGPETAPATAAGAPEITGTGSGTGTGAGAGPASAPDADATSVRAACAATSSVSAAAHAAPAGEAAAPGTAATGFPDAGPLPALDLRTHPQKRLDGLVGACKAALATGSLPATGGLRPQVMVTIGYHDLLTRLAHTTETTDTGHTAENTEDSPAENTPHATATRLRQAEHTGTGTLLFTGPVTASTARKIACDADIIPVLLGTEGRILDIGRTSRIFPPHIRKALTARDQGCTFPGCTIPAPWCEAHHITYWSRGGTTGTDNGTLLCSHHHHLIHKEHWTIQLRTGIPWFIPPPHLDPHQKPRRNHYFQPTALAARRNHGVITG